MALATRSASPSSLSGPGAWLQLVPHAMFWKAWLTTFQHSGALPFSQGLLDSPPGGKLDFLRWATNEDTGRLKCNVCMTGRSLGWLAPFGQ
jgi:hypothetical protein